MLTYGKNSGIIKLVNSVKYCKGGGYLNSDNLTDRLIEVLREYYYMKAPLELDLFMQGEMKVLSYICFEYSEKRETLPGEIAAALDMTGGRIAGILRSLEKKGYIIRRTDESDRRRAIIIPTKSGMEFVEQRTGFLHSRLCRIIETMGTDSAEKFISSMSEFVSACRRSETDK